MDVSFLDDRTQGLLGQAPRLQEGREVAALPELWNVQFHRAGAGFPHPVAVAVALADPIGATFAEAGTRQIFDLQRHQALDGKADHLAQQIGVGAFSRSVRRGSMSSVIMDPRFGGLVRRPNPTEDSRWSTL